jgi:hypothetical protein
LVAFNTTPAASGESPTRGVTIPDAKHRYQLTYNNNPFYHDRYCIATSQHQKGLLDSIEYASEDATPKIVLALAELGRKTGAFTVRLPEETTGFKAYTSVIVTFNPFDRDDRAAAAEIVNRTLNGKVRVRFDFPELDLLSQAAKDKCRGNGGVCFRTKVKTTMLLRDQSGNALSTAVVEVVNPNYIGHFDLDRAFLVEKIARLGFEDGALTHVTMKKPSEALQAVKLPIAVVDLILSIPSNFIATATGSSAQIKQQLEDQRTTIEALEQRLATAATETIYKETCRGRLSVN